MYIKLQCIGQTSMCSKKLQKPFYNSLKFALASPVAKVQKSHIFKVYKSKYDTFLTIIVDICFQVKIYLTFPCYHRKNLIK